MRNSNYLNTTKMMESLSDSFTDDAIFLIQSYFDKLTTRLDNSGVPSTKQKFIVRGLYYFINEYIEDHSHKGNLINFETTLEILNEIGSPTDIIQTISFSKDVQTIFPEANQQSGAQTISKVTPTSRSIPSRVLDHPIICKYCNTSNDPSSNYCESCGRNFFSQQELHQNIRQEMIDHNYFLIFITSCFFLGLLQIVLYSTSQIALFSVLFPDISLRPWGFPFPEELAISMILSFLPAVVITFICGFLIDELYLNKLKSSKQRYNQAIENFQGRFILGIWLTLAGILLITYLIINGYREFILHLFILLAVYSASFWNHFLIAGKPKDVPYFRLLRTKKILDNHIKRKYFMFMPTLLFATIILVTLWLIVANSLVHPDFLFQDLFYVGVLLLFTTFVVANGLFLVYYYNWSNVRKFLEMED